MGSDFYTELLRWALLTAQFGAAFVIWRISRTVPIHNPIPWVFVVGVHVTYGAAMFLLLAGSRIVVEGWWRPMWSILNIFTAVGSTWLIWRIVKRGDRL